MDSEELAHVREMLDIHQRRLRELEVKKAWYGPDAPIHVLMEIKDLKEEIARCRSQIDAFSKMHETPPVINPFQGAGASTVVQRQIEITFNGSFEHVTPEVQSAIVRAIAGMVEISPDQVTVLNIKAGSVIFSLELPSDAADRLLALYASRDEQIRELGIENVRLVTERELSFSTPIGNRMGEIESYVSHDPYETRSANEIFRRAIVEGSQAAWQEVVALSIDSVQNWIQRGTSRAKLDDFEKEETDDLVSRVFTRFRQIMTPEKYKGFSDLRSILRYLQMVTYGELADWLRRGRGIQLVQMESAAEVGEQEGGESADLWSLIVRRLKDDKEREVIYASFVLELSAREIYEQKPDLFESVRDVYAIKQKVMQRLRRDPELREIIVTGSSRGGE